MRIAMLAFAAALLGVAFIFSTLASAEVAAPADPMAWSPPRDAPLFIERIPIDEYPRRLVKARAWAEQLHEERAEWPAHGLRVTRTVYDKTGDKAGIAPGTILFKCDGEPLKQLSDFERLRKPQAQTFSVYSAADGVRDIVIQPGALGLTVVEFDRENLLQLVGDMNDPRWADDVTVAGRLAEEDPDFAETALARALHSGLPRNERLEFVAAQLALNSSHFDQAMAIAHHALARKEPRKFDFRSLFFQAAIVNYKLPAALDCANQSDDDDIRKHIPELQRLIAAHQALPDAERLAAAPSEQAAALFPDDLMVRAEMLDPAGSETREHANDRIPFTSIREGHVTELAALRPWAFNVAGARYDNIYFGPAAKRAYFGCQFTLAPSDTLHTRYERCLVIEFFYFKPGREKSVDAQTNDGKLYGVKFDPGIAPPLLLKHSLNVFARDFELPQILDDAEKEHRVEMYSIGGRLELRVDGRRVLYAPLDVHDASMGIKIWYNGVKGELRNVAFCDLLTADERKAQVDPDINNAYRFGWTRLHRMVQWAPEKAVAELLQAGANPSKLDNEGQTPLHLAVRSNRLAMVTLLAEKGASVLTVDKKGRNAYELAVALGCREIAAYLLKTHPELGRKAVRPSKEDF